MPTNPGHGTQAVLLLTVLFCCPARATEPARDWLSGRELAAKLAEPVTVAWAGAPLKRAIGDLARTHAIGLFLDRREDPDRLVTLSVKNTPLAEVCDKLAASAGIGFCQLDALGYFGPAGTCEALPTVAALHDDEVARLPAATRAPWSHRTAWSWPDFSTPRELAEQLAQTVHAQIENPERLPHDLWAASQLPPLSVAQRLTLIAAGFDLTFEFDDGGQRIRWVDWPQRPTIERSYSGGPRARELATAWAALAPHSTLKVEGTKIIVRGPLEDQQRIAAGRKTSTRPAAQPKQPGTPVYTLKLEGVPLARLLQELERKLDLQIKVDQPAVDRAKIDMQQNISLKVEKATLDQLLDAALKPAGLTFVRKGTKIEVRPKAK
ncbi:MAG TPA: STN domain-containing protein [Pirellulales bacterium]